MISINKYFMIKNNLIKIIKFYKIIINLNKIIFHKIILKILWIIYLIKKIKIDFFFLSFYYSYIYIIFIYFL
jgi:hypothetical protein